MESHANPKPAPLVVVMGVTGSGKTTVGRRVAAELGVSFVDADEFHSPVDVEAMRRGVALDNARRLPWLDRLHTQLVDLSSVGAVMACSALRTSYRRTLRGGLDRLRFVALVAPPGVLRERLAARRDHFAGPSLLDSQLATLELGGDVIVVDADASVDEVVARVLGVVDQLECDPSS